MSTVAESTTVFEPRRLGHVNLWVDDLKRSQSFYSETCGLAVEFWETDLVATFLGTGNTPHDVGMIETTGGEARYGLDGVLQIPAGVGTAPGLGHMAWELTNEVELVNGYRQLQEFGIEPEMTVDHQIAHSVYIRDPDGIQIEFYCDTVKEWAAVLHGQLKLVTSFWQPGSEVPFTDSRVSDTPEHHRVDSSPVHPTRLTHTVLATANYDEMVAYYRRIAGLTLVKSDATARVSWLGGKETSYPFCLVITEAADGESLGYHHVSFDLGTEAEVERTMERLAERGVAPEHTIDLPHKKSVFLVDPDGMRVEFYASRRSSIGHLDGIIPADRLYAV
jgi:catechol 2,3-dioxygenase